VPSPKGPIDIELRVEDATFDGSSFEGTVLVGVRGDPIAIDRRLPWGAALSFYEVRDCNGRRLEHAAKDEFPHRAEGADVIVLRRGEWFGRRARAILIQGGSPPECIDAVLTVRAERPYAEYQGRDLSAGDAQTTVRLRTR
jgi:hypothetical protein